MQENLEPIKNKRASHACSLHPMNVLDRGRAGHLDLRASHSGREPAGTDTQSLPHHLVLPSVALAVTTLPAWGSLAQEGYVYVSQTRGKPLPPHTSGLPPGTLGCRKPWGEPRNGLGIVTRQMCVPARPGSVHSWKHRYFECASGFGPRAPPTGSSSPPSRCDGSELGRRMVMTLVT